MTIKTLKRLRLFVFFLMITILIGVFYFMDPMQSIVALRIALGTIFIGTVLAIIFTNLVRHKNNPDSKEIPLNPSILASQQDQPDYAKYSISSTRDGAMGTAWDKNVF